MNNQTRPVTNFNSLPKLPSKKDEQNEKAGIIHFIRKIFRKHKADDKHRVINPVTEAINHELIYRISCDKLRYRSSLLNQTLIINSLQNHLGAVPKVHKRKSCRLLLKSNDDEDVPLGMLKLSKMCLVNQEFALNLSKRVSRFDKLPDELILMILKYLSNTDLLQTRSANIHIGAVSQEVLRFRTNSRMNSLNAQLVDTQSMYLDLLDEKKPRLDHFRGFLLELPQTHIQEAAWYSVVPHELLTICECLVILKQGPFKSTDPVEKWAQIKKIMSKYEFKSWYVNLRENVNDLDMHNVLKVQEIIMYDPSITYERVNAVSVCGYNILIAIAASLQFATISNDMRILQNQYLTLQKTVQMSMRFLNAL